MEFRYWHFQVLTYCNFSNFGLIKQYYKDDWYRLMSIIRNQYCNFLFFRKHKKCSYFYNFGRIWLINELVLTFWAPIKYAKAQFNPKILSGLINIRPTTDRQTETSAKTRISKNKNSMKISKVIFNIELITSYLL